MTPGDTAICGTFFCQSGWTSDGDFTWTRMVGPTPSLGTGPSSGPDGGNYAYVEATEPNNPRRVAYLSSAAGRYRGLRFRYHMYGQHMGSLVLRTRAAAGAPWREVWRQDVAQQRYADDPWREVEVVFRGPVLGVQFKAVTGPGWSGDAAVATPELYGVRRPPRGRPISFLAPLDAHCAPPRREERGFA